MQILNKLFLYIVWVVLPIVSIAQKEKDVWQQEKEKLEYRKSEDYDGPRDWSGASPSNMKEENLNNLGSGGSGNSANSGQGIQYVPQQIQRDRQERFQGYDRGGGEGTLPYDPTLDRPEPIEGPDIDPPDIDAPDVDVDAPKMSPGFGNFLMILFIIAVLFLIAYLIVRNWKPSNKKITVAVADDWNPEIISKTELELRLEQAMLEEDYRECIRIYFTFILKELIRKNWITWKKEKTNYHYVLEMARRPEAHRFSECVRVYDLVWYGEYHIDRDIFELLQPGLDAYYKSLDPKDE